MKKLEKKTTKSLQKNAQILKWKENEKKKKKKDNFLLCIVYLYGLPIVALTLKFSVKNNWCLVKMVKTKA